MLLKYRVFHFLINGENGGDFTVLIENDTCKITEGLTGDAKCTVKSSAEVFDMVMTGKMNPTMAVMGGKLKISNIGEIKSRNSTITQSHNHSLLNKKLIIITLYEKYFNYLFNVFRNIHLCE